jgi:hypothetical protein
MIVSMPRPYRKAAEPAGADRNIPVFPPLSRETRLAMVAKPLRAFGSRGQPP